MEVKLDANLGYCLNCKLPFIIVDGKIESPTSTVTGFDLVLYFDVDPNSESHRRRVTWHYEGCDRLSLAG